jgi:hypothetical protein
MRFAFAHDFDIAAEDFWTMFFSDEYEQALWKHLKLANPTILERKDEGNVYRRSVRLEPEVQVPAWAASVVSSTGYTEHDLLHRDRGSMDVRIEPHRLKDRFQLHGTFRVTALSPGRCRREFSGEVQISVLLIGGKLEAFMVDRLREGYDSAAAMTRDFIARKKSAA